MDKLAPKKIHFHFAFHPFTLRNRTELKQFIESIFIRERRRCQALNVIFCNNRKIRSLNKEYLGHDHATDILTFDLSKKGESIVSDLFISQEQVKLNARQFRTSFKKEIHRVVFHGILHLCGYKDKTKKDRSVMRAREDYYLNKYFSF
jgi:probable rRNA maturation factor